MSFKPTIIDKKTTDQKRKKWASIKVKKEKEYIPYPFEDYVENTMKVGTSFDITKKEWFDHINAIRKTQGKEKTTAGPSIFMMMKSKKINMEDQGCVYNTIHIAKWVDEETAEHLGWNIKKVWEPYEAPGPKSKKGEDK